VNARLLFVDVPHMEVLSVTDGLGKRTTH